MFKKILLTFTLSLLSFKPAIGAYTKVEKICALKGQILTEKVIRQFFCYLNIRVIKEPIGGRKLFTPEQFSFIEQTLHKIRKYPGILDKNESFAFWYDPIKEAAYPTLVSFYMTINFGPTYSSPFNFFYLGSCYMTINFSSYKNETHKFRSICEIKKNYPTQYNMLVEELIKFKFCTKKELAHAENYKHYVQQIKQLVPAYTNQSIRENKLLYGSPSLPQGLTNFILTLILAQPFISSHPQL